MNLPNKLTVLRICLVPFFVFFILVDIPWNFTIAFVLFTVAAYTDRLDGKIARRDNLVTNFGKLMDPLADKIMVMSALLCFIKLDLAWTVCIIIILFRELAITSIRMLAVEQNKVIAANNWGKAKTVIQIVAIISILLFQSSIEIAEIFGHTVSLDIVNALYITGHALIILCTAITIVSGVIYAKDNAEVMMG